MAQSEREKRVAHLQDPLLRQEMIRLLDLAERVRRQEMMAVTGFLDPHAAKTGQSLLAGMPGVSFAASGGFPGAERQRLLIMPDDTGEDAGEDDFCLAFLRVEGNFKYCQVSHRDYLGSLLGLGISRDKVGDILVTEEGCHLILDRDIAPYVLSQWQQVSQVAVRVREVTAGDILPESAAVREIRSTVASLRLDAILGLGFGVSRGKLTDEITAGRVRLNWQTVTDPGRRVAEGDRISWQGHGRIVLHQVSGPSQKGRIFVAIHRFL